MKPIAAICFGLVILFHAGVSWILINPNGLEPISDEGAYVVLAKALATTGDYKMISLPGEPHHTKYPILFPWLLSRIWKVSPDFPANVSILRSLNIAFGVGFLIVLVPLFRKLCGGDVKQALLLVSLCAINPALLSSSTTLSSEASYLFFSMLAVLAVVELEQRSWNPPGFVLAVISLGAAFYVRVPALALLTAAEVHLLLRRRLRQAIGLGLGAAIFLIPWLYWCHTHNDSARFPEYIFYNDYISDFRQFISSHGLGSLLVNNIILILVGIPKLLIYPFEGDLRVIMQLTAWLGLAATGLLALGFIRSYQRKETRLIHWYVVTYLVMLLLWPYPAGERFLEPLLPFFYWFILVEIRQFIGSVVTHFRSERRFLVRALPTALVLCIGCSWAIASLLSFGMHSGRFVASKRQELATYEARYREMNESFRWLQRETAPSDLLMANLYPLYYLHTGRKTAPVLFDPSRKLTEPRFDDAPIWKHGIKYLIVSDLDFAVYVPEIVKALQRELKRAMEANEGLMFEKKFTSQLGNYEVYKIQRTNRKG